MNEQANKRALRDMIHSERIKVKRHFGVYTFCFFLPFTKSLSLVSLNISISLCVCEYAISMTSSSS